MAGNIQQLMASPIYPPEAKAKGLTGTVLLRDVITTKGTLTHLRVIHSSDPIFTDAAITSVQQSSYRSFMQNESVEIEITVNFTK
jgi:protein TonB